MQLVGVFAVVALALAIRSAVGARRSGTFRLLPGRAAKPILAGLIVGEFASGSLARVLTGVLDQVNARDPLTFAGAALLLAIGALAACVMTARRALRLDPRAILRSE
jgi:putative ABC transport system permease protein